MKLPNGCRCSEPVIHGNTLSDIWYIHYRFYNEAGEMKQMKYKGGLNRIKNLKDRKQEAKEILAETIRMLKIDGANPIIKKDNTVNIDYQVHPTTPFIDALTFALSKVDVEHGTYLGIKSMLKSLTKAAIALNVDSYPISKVTRKEAVMALNKATTGKSANAFNWHRKYLMILFKYLVEIMAVDVNPIREISKKSTVTTIKETLSLKQRHEVDRHLKKKGLNSFRLFLRIFFTSGARITELLKVQAFNVNLKEQWFLVTIKKGANKKQVRKTIGNSSLRYWKLVLRNANRADYIFGKGLVAGPVQITAAQVTRRWETHVKGKKDKGGLEITADMYSLKHSRTTETVGRYGTQIAAEQNSHTTDAMVIKIYDVDAPNREHERLKKVDVRF